MQNFASTLLFWLTSSWAFVSLFCPIRWINETEMYLYIPIIFHKRGGCVPISSVSVFCSHRFDTMQVIAIVEAFVSYPFCWDSFLVWACELSPFCVYSPKHSRSTPWEWSKLLIQCVTRKKIVTLSRFKVFVFFISLNYPSISVTRSCYSKSKSETWPRRNQVPRFNNKKSIYNLKYNH